MRRHAAFWLAFFLAVPVWAQTTASSTQLTDTNGSSVSLYTLGTGRIFVTVTDLDKDTDGLGSTNSVTLTLVQVTRSGGDTQSNLVLQETSTRGVFRGPAGGLPTALAATAVSGNGTLEALSFDPIQALYVDPLDSGDVSSSTGTVARASTTATVRFTNATFAQDRAVYILTLDGISLQIDEPDRNVNPSVADSFTISVQDTGGDSETVTLNETGADTGIFRTTVALSAGAAAPGNGSVQTQSGNTITARYDDTRYSPAESRSDTVLAQALTAATLIFSNSGGTAQATYDIGSQGVFATLTDKDQDTDPTSQQTVNVSLVDSVTGDAETLTLAETGNATGIFRNVTGLNTVRAAAVSGNGQIETQPGATLTVNYTDPRRGTETAQATATTRLAPTASSTIFTNQSGTAAFTYVIGTDRVFVTVTDSDQNASPTLAETVRVTLTLAATSDTEVLTLTETGVNTGVFRNASPGVASSRVFTGAPGNGTLESTDNATVRADYRDAINGTDTSSATAVLRDFRPSVTAFTDVVGAARTSYVIGAGNIFVTVTDADVNFNPALAERVNVIITVAATGDSETVELVETGVSTGIFRNQTGVPSQIGAAASNGLLDVTASATATATYTDAHDATDRTSSQATLIPVPASSSIRFTDQTGAIDKTQYLIAAENIFVTLTDADENQNGSLAETVLVDLVDATTGDQERITLTETGASTGVFRNATGVPSVIGTAVNQDGTLQTANLANLTANYRDDDDAGDASVDFVTMRLSPTASNTFFSDNAGNPRSLFTIAANDIFVTLQDPDRNSSPTTAQSLTVSLRNSANGDQETVTLIETGTDTGFFRNSVPIQTLLDTVNVTVGNNSLEVRDNDTITALYSDTVNPPDTSSGAAVVRFITASTTFFSNAAGIQQTQFTIGTDLLFVTVIDRDQGSTQSPPPTVRTVLVSVRDPVTNDVKNITLTEDASVLGTFRNTTGLPMQRGAANPGATGTLFVAGNSVLQASYADPDDNSDTSVGTATAINVSTNANVQFTDNTGASVVTVDIATGLFVTVSDDNVNHSATVSETVTVTLIDGSTGDSETLLVTETGPNTGVFRNAAAFPMQVAPPVPDNRLQSADGSTLTANYTDPDTGEFVPGFATARRGVDPANPRFARFTSSSGSPVTTYGIGDPASLVFVTVEEPDANLNAAVSDTVSVTIRDTNVVGADTVVVQLREVSPSTGQLATNTGIFRNITGIVSSLLNPPLVNNTLEVLANDFITVDYVPRGGQPPSSAVIPAQMLIKQGNSTAAFTNSTGGIRTSYTITTDGIFVTVTDADQNGNPASAEQLAVTVVSTITGDTETGLVLTETGPNTGVFRNSTALPSVLAAASPGDGTLQTASSAILTANYTDPDDGTDTSVATAQIFVQQAPATRIEFRSVNPSGLTTTRYEILTAGRDRVFVHLEDADANEDPTSLQSVTVQVIATGTPMNDTETVTLTETGISTGIFENSVAPLIVVAPPAPADLTVQSFDGGGLSAMYRDPQTPGDVLTAFATVGVGRTPVTTVFFSNTTGVTRTTYIAAVDPVFLTVVDADGNRNATLAETLRVTLTSPATGDALSIVLTETGLATGTFRNLSGVTTAIAAAAVNGVLEVATESDILGVYRDPRDSSDTATGRARMKPNPINSQTRTTDAFGTTKATFRIGTELLFVTVTDPDQNRNAGLNDTVTVSLTSPITGDIVNLSLLEISPNSGIFRNTVGVTSVIAPVNLTDALLQTADGDQVRASYQDPSTPADQSFFIATMQVTRVPSQVLYIPVAGSLVTTTTFDIGTQNVFLRVVDPDNLRNPTVVETVRVTLVNEATTDNEVVTLTEVNGLGVATANGLRFETIGGVPSRVDLPTPGNGSIEASSPSTLTATYIDAFDATDRSSNTATLRTPFTSPTIAFTDPAGTNVSVYTVGATTGVFITVNDAQANVTASTSVRDSVVTSIFDQTTGNVVAVELFELPDTAGVFNTGIFRNPIRVDSVVSLPPADVTTRLFTADNAIILGSYFKSGLAGGPTPTTTTAFDPTVARILTGKGPNGQSCFDCHSQANPQGQLNVTGFRDLNLPRPPGAVTPGSIVVPGNSQASILIRKLDRPSDNPFALNHPSPGGGDPALRVGGVISDADLIRLKAWIDEGAVAPTLPTSLTYQDIQTQVFTPSCQSRGSPLGACHDFGTQAGGIRLDDETGFRDAIRNRAAAVLGNGPGSRIVQVVTDPGFNHSGSRAYGPSSDPRFINDAPVQLLSMYISQQYPLDPRSPLKEYTSDVQPYFDRNCTTSGCHDRKDRAGGLDLTSIQGLRMGGTSGATANPGDVPSSPLLRMLDAVLEPAHVALVPPSFYTSQGPIEITSWVNQGAVAGASIPLSGPPSGAVTDSAVMKVGPTTATISFTDGGGVVPTFYSIGIDFVFVTIVDSNRNLDPTTSETINVTLTDSLSTDEEGLVLRETGPGTSIFRNVDGLPTRVAGRVLGNGIVETRQDSVLTATYTDPRFPETRTATITLSANVRGRLRFVDTSGLPVGQYSIGTQPVVIQVEDADQSGKTRLDASVVRIDVSPTGDLEQSSLVMSEVSTRPGFFESQPLTTIDRVSPTSNNGQLETQHLGVLTATYVDPTFPTDTVTVSAVTKVAPTDSQTLFTDSTGVTRTNAVVIVDDLFVTVRDANRNVNVTTTDSVTVTVFNDQLGDSVMLTLTEVGVNSGIFRNTTGLPTQLADVALTTDSILQVRDTGIGTIPIRAEYIDIVSAPDVSIAFGGVIIDDVAQLSFTSAAGSLVTTITRSVDLIFLTLRDGNRNMLRSVAETVKVTVFDDSIVPGDQETLTLTETGVNTGVFRNPLTGGLRSVFGFPAAIRENALLETRVNSVLNPTDVVRATYIDPFHLTDVATATVFVIPKDPNDSDDDKIPDAYEAANGLNPLDPTDAALDFDQDGFTNLEEFLQGTDPRNPFDNKPIANPGPSRTVDPGVIQLDGSASTDPRRRPLTYRWTQVNVGTAGHGPLVTLSSATAVAPTFIGLGGRNSAGQDLSLFDFDLVVTNPRVASNPARININVRNVPPTPFAGIDQALNLGESILLNGNESADANGETALLLYSWSRPAGSGAFNVGVASPRVVPQIVGRYDFGLTCIDPASNTNTDPLFVVVHGPANHVPTANVPARIAGTVGAPVSIDGSLSADADPGELLTYRWTVTKTPAGAGTVTVVPPVSNVASANIVPPRAGYYEVTLVTSDLSGNRSIPVTAGIVVDFAGTSTQPPDRTPVAVTAANQQALVGQTVTLDGRASRDADGAALTFLWTQVRGLRVALSSNTVSTPSFVPLQTGVYGFDLVVSDGVNESAPARTFVVVSTTSQRVPVAVAGRDQTVTLDSSGLATAILDGSGSSDADGQSLTYYWRQVSGPGIALANRESSRPTLITRKDGSYVFELTVYDGKNFSLPSRTTIQVNPAGVNQPLANPGLPQTIYFTGDPVVVNLDGRNSVDPQGLALSFSWTQTDGPPVVLEGAQSATPRFTATQISVYKFELVVRNTRGVASLPGLLIVTVVDGNGQPPDIRINGSGGGAATVRTGGGAPVTLDARASSSVAGGTLTFVWRQVAGPAVILSGSSSPQPSFTPQTAGTYIFEVLVIDGRSNQATGQVTVFVGSDAPSTGGAIGSSLPTAGAPKGGGGGGGGCRAGAGSSDAGTLWPLLLLWLALLTRTRGRRFLSGS